jgi:hypothetical protein
MTKYEGNLRMTKESNKNVDTFCHTMEAGSIKQDLSCQKSSIKNEYDSRTGDV